MGAAGATVKQTLKHTPLGQALGASYGAFPKEVYFTVPPSTQVNISFIPRLWRHGKVEVLRAIPGADRDCLARSIPHFKNDPPFFCTFWKLT